MSGFDTLGRRVARAAASQRDSKALLAGARERFAEHLYGIDAPAPSRWRFVAPALALAAAVGLALVLWPEAPLGVQLRGQPEAPVDFVAAAPGAEEVMDFSDGSEVRVREASELRLLGVTAQGAQVSLERGAAHVQVVHRQQTRWTFSAGPYRVHVVGTEFELRWNPDTHGLVVEMDDGIVEVDGPGLARQRVTSRQKLEAFAEPASASLYLEAAPVAAGTDDATTAPAKRRREQDRPVEPPRYTGPSWRQLADKGDARGAMSAAEQAGFTWLARSMPLADVLALGDVARKAKEPQRATEAWLAVRERFSGTVGASEAALRLGELADAQRDVDGALRWFRQAAQESPNAPTAPTALGRQLEVLVRAQRDDEAKLVAAEYLARFKNGPDAPAAKAALRR